MIAANFSGAALRLTRVVRAVQRAPAQAAIGARVRCQVVVDAQQQRKEHRVVQEGMAH